MRTILISDSTIKQVEMNKAFSLSFKEKLEVCKLLDKLGVDLIELDEIKNPRIDILLVKSVVTAVKNSRLAVPVKLGESAENVVKALEEAKSFRLQVHAPMSSVRMEYIYHKKPVAIKEMVLDTIKSCKEYTDDVEFVAEDATRSDMAFLAEMIEAAIDAGVKTITICDDAGNMFPREFSEFIKNVYENVPKLENISLGVKCSNDLSLADACALSAVCRGATEVKVASYPDTISSLRNVAKIFSAKAELMDVTVAINANRISRTICQIERLCSNDDSVVSVNMVGNDNIEQLINSNDDIDFVSKTIEKMGYDLSEEDLNNVFEGVKEIAKKKEYVSSRELDAIIASEAMQVPSKYKLNDFVVTSGKDKSAMVQIMLEVEGQEKNAVSLGDGPIAAAFHGIEQIADCEFELEDFQIKAVTQGKEAAGEAIVKLRAYGKLYSGRGLSTDIISASIRAFLNALNKAVYEKE